MAGKRFYLKENDTRPVLKVTLLDPGSTDSVPIPHDCTSEVSCYLHIYLNNGTEIEKDMVFDADRTTGIVYYTWVAADWTDTIPLIVGPTIPLSATDVDHKMEYECVDAAGGRTTFPNNGYDFLTIYPEIGQGA